jgi:hypothetical protein
MGIAALLYLHCTQFLSYTLFSAQSFHCTKHYVSEDQHKGQSPDRESSHDSNRIFPRLNGREFPHAFRKSLDTSQRGKLAKRSSVVRLGKSKVGFLNFDYKKQEARSEKREAGSGNQGSRSR